MNIAELEILDQNGNTRLVKRIQDIKNLQEVGVSLTFTVPKKLENKIWAITEILYGDTEYIGRLMHYNNLNPHIVKEGTILRIPNMDDYEEASSSSRDNSRTKEQTSTSITKRKNSNSKIVTSNNGRITFSKSTTK